MSFQMVVGITHFRSDQITHLSYIKTKKQTSILTNVISDINGRVFVLYIYYLCSTTLPQLLKHIISDRAVCILTTYTHTHTHTMDGWVLGHYGHLISVHSLLSLLRFSAPTFLLLLDLDRTLNLDRKYQLYTPDIGLFMLSLNVTYWKYWNMSLLVNKKMFLWLILMDLIFLQKEFWNE